MSPFSGKSKFQTTLACDISWEILEKNQKILLFFPNAGNPQKIFITCLKLQQKVVVALFADFPISCSELQCLNGGTCMEVPLTLAFCNCPAGFTGPTCAGGGMTVLLFYLCMSRFLMDGLCCVVECSSSVK